MVESSNITHLLAAMTSGEEGALERLTPIVYEELRQLAGALLRSAPAGQTLRTTALVHEAYVKLVRQQSAEFETRQQFFAFAARVMRNVLVDYARERRAAKRGGDQERLQLDEVLSVIPGTEVDMMALNESLERLEQIDERKAQVVELRFFGGQKLTEIAAILEVSETTVERDWRMARAWLHKELTAGRGPRE